MDVKTFTIANQLGLHARPASLFVQTASRYACEVLVEKEGTQMKVNGKSIMGLLMLAAEKGSKLKVTADGQDSPACMDSLDKLITERKFDEE